MYFKEFNFRQDETTGIDAEEITRRLKEARSIKYMEEKNFGFYGEDERGNFFVVKIYERFTELDIEIESDNYGLLEEIATVILDIGIEPEKIKSVNQFSLLKNIKDDVAIIKGIMVFYLVISIIGFILSIFA